MTATSTAHLRAKKFSRRAERKISAIATHNLRAP